MKNWIRKNLTLTILLAALSSIIGYTSSQAVARSDVDRLNAAVFGKNSQGDDLSSRLVRVEQNTNDIKELLIKGYIPE